MAGTVSYMDAYFAIQEWKKLQTTSDGYETKALNILEVRRLTDLLHCTVNT